MFIPIHAELFRILSTNNLTALSSAAVPVAFASAPTFSSTTLLVTPVETVRLYAFGGARVTVTLPAPPPLPPAVPDALFTDKERAAILAYWNKPGRYIVGQPTTPSATPWQVRLTPDGSQWFLRYQQALVGPGKIPPTRDVHPTSGPYAEWEQWITTRLAWDKYQAQIAADRANVQAAQAREHSATSAVEAIQAATDAVGAAVRTDIHADAPVPAQTRDSEALRAGISPPQPGPIPAGLLAACGNPPPLAASVLPLEYRVTTDAPEETFTYVDNVKLRDRYGYYRFAQGVVSYGTRVEALPAKECDGLFRAAGFTPSEQRAFCAVSAHEGGFETVQTYDTGFVSVGFIQFVTLEEGKHDLSNVLLQMKQDKPGDFARDFHRFGIDVRPDHTITVLDPQTGAELLGAEAVRCIINDKRLTAVFQRAGRRSAFQVAQIKVARSYYWPQEDPLEIPMPDGTTLVGRVRDVVHSEAGVATLLDRKINIGNIRALAPTIRQTMLAHGCKSLTDAALYEREIIAALRYREDFLANTTLAQPKPLPMRKTPTMPPGSTPSSAVPSVGPMPVLGPPTPTMPRAVTFATRSTVASPVAKPSLPKQIPYKPGQTVSKATVPVVSATPQPTPTPVPFTLAVPGASPSPVPSPGINEPDAIPSPTSLLVLPSPKP